MSFDFRIINGDISFDDQGRTELVRNNNKLVQAVLKLISTTLGSDPFEPSYGLGITSASLGTLTTANITQQKMESEITSGLEALQAEQQSLAQIQVLTPGEIIQNIDYVVVEQDETDPRQYNIFIELTTLERTPITVTTAIRG